MPAFPQLPLVQHPRSLPTSASGLPFRTPFHPRPPKQPTRLGRVRKDVEVLLFPDKRRKKMPLCFCPFQDPKLGISSNAFFLPCLSSFSPSRFVMRVDSKKARFRRPSRHWSLLKDAYHLSSRLAPGTKIVVQQERHVGKEIRASPPQNYNPRTRPQPPHHASTDWQKEIHKIKKTNT